MGSTFGPISPFTVLRIRKPTSPMDAHEAAGILWKEKLLPKLISSSLSPFTRCGVLYRSRSNRCWNSLTRSRSRTTFILLRLGSIGGSRLNRLYRRYLRMVSRLAPNPLNHSLPPRFLLSRLPPILPSLRRMNVVLELAEALRALRDGLNNDLRELVFPPNDEDLRKKPKDNPSRNARKASASSFALSTLSENGFPTRAKSAESLIQRIWRESGNHSQITSIEQRSSQRPCERCETG
jgi:hypothetical protein